MTSSPTQSLHHRRTLRQFSTAKRAAADELQPRRIRKVEIEATERAREREGVMTQLYVGNLSADGDEKAIRTLFSRYGMVREVLMKNGYAFVEFEDACSADSAMRELNGERPVATAADL